MAGPRGESKGEQKRVIQDHPVDLNLITNQNR